MYHLNHVTQHINLSTHTRVLIVTYLSTILYVLACNSRELYGSDDRTSQRRPAINCNCLGTHTHTQIKYSYPISPTVPPTHSGMQ